MASSRSLCLLSVAPSAFLGGLDGLLVLTSGNSRLSGTSRRTGTFSLCSGASLERPYRGSTEIGVLLLSQITLIDHVTIRAEKSKKLQILEENPTHACKITSQ